MPVKVIIPTPLRQYADKKESLEVQAKTVAEALAAVTSQYADLRKHLYNDEGKLAFVVVQVFAKVGVLRGNGRESLCHRLCLHFQRLLLVRVLAQRSRNDNLDRH